MNRFFKLGLILAGYAAAPFAAYVAFILLTQNAPPQGSGGMQDFGDALLFLGLFGVFALVPTALALYFMRSFQKFWTAFSIATLTFAVTGPVAAIMFPRLPESSWWVIVGVLDLLRVLGAPLLCLGFLIFAVIAPTRLSRRALLAAAVIEARWARMRRSAFLSCAIGYKGHNRRAVRQIKNAHFRIGSLADITV